MTAPDGKIRIPLNEEGKGGGGQIEEFLRAYQRRGHPAHRAACDDLLATWDQLQQLGVPFMTAPPETYYEMLDERLPGHGEPVERAADARHPARRHAPRAAIRACCCRSSPRPMIGPVFFEFIQRKGDEGFGEGNFTALFEVDRARPGSAAACRATLDARDG